MRFKADIQNAGVFSRFVGSLTSIGKVAWVRLTDADVRFTIIPEQGTQVWAVLSIDTIFDPYNIQSAAASNAINLEVPLPPLLSALRSTSNATSASIRLTKRDGAPYLVITIATSVERWHGSNSNPAVGGGSTTAPPFRNQHRTDDLDDPSMDPYNPHANNTVQLVTRGNSSETIITQDIPVRVLGAEAVAGLHEPRCREPDVHIVLPPLTQLKGISERFMKLAVATSATPSAGGGGRASDAAAAGLGGGKSPRLELSATMHGDLRLALRNDGLKIASTWSGLTNPELDPGAVEGGEEGVQRHPSTRMRGRVGKADGQEGANEEEEDDEDLLERGWARVRIDGRDWSRVLSVGRLGGRVIACFCHDHALILYVYLSNGDSGADDSVLTYYVSSYSL